MRTFRNRTFNILTIDKDRLNELLLSVAIQESLPQVKITPFSYIHDAEHYLNDLSEAVKVHNAEFPDIVFLAMPSDKSKMTATLTAMKDARCLSRMPLIILSENYQCNPTCLELGATACYQRPQTVNELLTLTHQIIDLWVKRTKHF
jgi:hypothetical protein